MENWLTPGPHDIHPNYVWLRSLNCAELDKFELSSVCFVGNGLQTMIRQLVNITMHLVAEFKINIIPVYLAL